jgi:tetratricopeptide (TPR) repeat protein
MKVRNLPSLVRWPVAVVMFFLTAWFFCSLARLKPVEGETINFTALMECLYAFGTLITGAVLIAPELAELAAAPLNHLIENALFPTYSEDPPVDYRLARRYRAEGRYEEAVDQYYHILEYHPEELLAYLEGMETAFEGESPETAGDLCRKGLRKLSSPDARMQVQRIFDNLAEENSL